MNTLKQLDLHTNFVLDVIKALPIKIKYSLKMEPRTVAICNCSTNTVPVLHGNDHSHLLEKYRMF
jgi:hypothetical protein